MFISKEHHPQLLDRDCYSGAEQFESEVANLLLPSWHAVAVRSELPREGSYLTFEMMGNPIILWRKNHEIHAFLNVCSHRFSQLTRDSCGQCDRLKCKYHGWEFDQTGNVRHIPDARTFRPLEPGMVGLRKFHTATCGELVFVSMADDPPGLREFLGSSAFETYESWFTPEMHTAIVCTRKINANWKLLIENALESYHTTEVHPKTFGQSPPEQDCEHRLEENWTSLTVHYENERSFRHWLDCFGHRMVGAVPTHMYQHFLHYPNVMLSQLSLYRWFESVIPVSPTESLSVVRLMCNVGRSRSLMRGWNRFWVSRWANTFLMQVGEEDAAVLVDVQGGMSARDKPLGGLISTREERIMHFQKYIQSQLLGSGDGMNGGDQPSTLKMRQTN